ncbi:citryl-CoA lyase [Aquabacterium sp.]|uniref:citryl-CoA lyase n=1 Tax=Aquabacterium sp. TaxID=1872578 RepID=UPI003784DD3D
MSGPSQPIHTRIWREEPEAVNPFSARAAYCHGYDVFGELVGRASWIEMLYLLLRGQAPSATQAALLEALAVALANPGPREASVHAAMCGGVCGSNAAASLIAALGVGAGQQGGAREVLHAMQGWAASDLRGDRWSAWLAERREATLPVSTWPATSHAPGFDPHGATTPTPVRQLLDHLAAGSPGAVLGWLREHRIALEDIAQAPLAFTGVAAAAFCDLGFTPEQGEMLYLLLRLPGAAAHALEQADYGHKRFPFYANEIENDPGVRTPIDMELSA